MYCKFRPLMRTEAYIFRSTLPSPPWVRGRNIDQYQLREEISKGEEKMRKMYKKNSRKEKGKMNAKGA